MKRVLILLLWAGLAGAAAANELTLLDEGMAVTGAARVPLLGTLQDVTVLTEADIARAHARSLSDLLRRVPGLTIEDQSGDCSDPLVMAGGYTDWNIRATVLVDGIPMTRLINGSVAWSQAPPLALVRRIEIRRGSGAPLYGSAVGVTVLVFLKDGLSAPAGEVDAAVTAGSGSSISGCVRGMDGNLQVAAAVEREVNQGWRDNADYRATRFALRGGLLLSPQSDLAFGLSLVDDATGWPGPLDRGTRERARESTLQRDDGAERDVASGYLRYQRDFLPELRWEGTAEYQGEQVDWYTAGQAILTNGWQAGTRQQVTWLTAVGATQHQVVAGGEYRTSWVDATTCTAPQRQRTGQIDNDAYKINRGSLFVDDYITLFDWPVYFEAGARYDRARYTCDDHGNPAAGGGAVYGMGSPVIGAGWRYIREGLLWTRWSRTMIDPEAYWGGTPSPVGKDQAIEIGIKHAMTREAEGYLTWFHHRVHEPYNLGMDEYDDARQRGVVLGGSYNWQSMIRANASYTYTDARWSGGLYGNRKVLMVPSRRCEAGVEYLDPGQRFDCGLFLHYAGRRPLDDENTRWLAPHIEWDIEGNFYWQTFTVYAQVRNLFDHEYDEYGYLAGTTEMLAPHHDRQFRAGVKYQF